MADLQEDIAKVKEPGGVRDASYASSAYVLREAFRRDPTVQRLIRAGKAVTPLIAREMSGRSTRLSDTALACFTFILTQVAPEAAVELLRPRYRAAVEAPEGPFFASFATDALRQALHMPALHSLDYSPADEFETLGRMGPEGGDR
jgi:hypothetical protein